jgi:hypothetical protein
MTATPNPFADDPPPQHVTRLQSAADPLNPYAAPTSPESQERPEVVGVWRDGPLLVMHRRAILPEVCVVTGEPTTHRHWETLHWRLPVDWGGRALIVEYGIQPHIQRAGRKFPLLSVAISAIVWIVSLAVASGYIYESQLGIEESISAYQVAMLLSSILTGLCFLPTIITRRQKKCIELVNVERHYVWLRGPGEAFLQTLPPWSETEMAGK